MALIKQYFEHFEITQDKVDSWHELLHDADFEQVRDNLIRFVNGASFRPKLLTCWMKNVIVDRINAIPSIEETKTILQVFPLPLSKRKRNGRQLKSQKRKLEKS